MIRLSKKFDSMHNLQTRMLLQIHDELFFEVPKVELKNISNIVRQEMTSVAKSDLHSFSIPLTVDINSGENWGILH